MRPIHPEAPTRTIVRRSSVRPNYLAATVLWLLTVPAPVLAQAPAGPGGAGSHEVILRPGDALTITVWPNAELGGEFPIEETGMVQLPYLGSVRAAGVPIQDLRDQLRRGYATAVQNPVVTVTPVFQVSLLGEVRIPGNYPATPTTTFFELVGMAGGFTGAADTENIRLSRAGRVIEIDAVRAMEAGDEAENLRLNSGDQILVPARGGIPWGAILTVVQTGLTFALIIDRFNN